MKKKYLKYLALVGLLMFFAVFTTACAQTSANTHPPTGGLYGGIYKYIAIPLQHLISMVAKQIGGPNAYGWGIIIISFVVRLILLPLALQQAYKSTLQQEKMKKIKPQLDMIQEAQAKATTPEAQQKMSQLMMDTYKKNDLSMMGGMGCLPLLIQLPILIGIYQAVQYSPAIYHSTFYGIPLGKPSVAIAIIATLFYVAQAYISMIGISEEQKKQMRSVIIMNPLMTFVISMVSSAALALYFLVGGVVSLIQQLIVTFVLTPQIRKNIDAQLEDKPVVEVVNEDIINDIIGTGRPSVKDVTGTGTSNDEDESKSASLHKKNRERNQNHKQNKKKD